MAPSFETTGREEAAQEYGLLSYPRTQDGRITLLRRLESRREHLRSSQKQGVATEKQDEERHIIEFDQGRILYDLIASRQSNQFLPITLNIEHYPGERITPVSGNAFFAHIGERGNPGSASMRGKLSRIRISGIVNDSEDAYNFLRQHCPITPYARTKRSFLKSTFSELDEVSKLLRTAPMPVSPTRRQLLEGIELDLITERVMRFFQGNEGDGDNYTEFAYERDPETDEPLAIFFNYRDDELRDTYITTTPFTTRNQQTALTMRRTMIQMLQNQAA